MYIVWKRMVGAQGNRKNRRSEFLPTRRVVY
jgi:hypothetical protein